MKARPLRRAASVLGKGLLQYRYKPNHRVSAAVYLRLRLTSLAHAVFDTAVRPQPDSDTFCFVTGCGHSGTTLLASKLGLHPDVLLISRESNIFAPQQGLRLARIIVRPDAVERWELCAFNNLCRDKYTRLGLEWQFAATPLLSRSELDQAGESARASGFDPQRVFVTGAARLKDL